MITQIERDQNHWKRAKTYRSGSYWSDSWAGLLLLMHWDYRRVDRSWDYAWVPASASGSIDLRSSNNIIWGHLMHRLVNVFESCPPVVIAVATHSWDRYRILGRQRLLLILLRQARHFARSVSFWLKMCNACFLFQLSNLLCASSSHFLNGTLMRCWHILHVVSPCHRVLATKSGIASRSHNFRSVQLLLAGLGPWLASYFGLTVLFKLNLVGQCSGSIAFQDSWHAWSDLLGLVCSFGLWASAFLSMEGLSRVREFSNQSFSGFFLARFMPSWRY